jgi:hypothetical protein
MLEVDRYVDDYERIYYSGMMGQGGFGVAEPFNGIPRMEAIFGCYVQGTKNSFVSDYCIDPPENYKMEVIRSNAVEEFVEKHLKNRVISKVNLNIRSNVSGKTGASKHSGRLNQRLSHAIYFKEDLHEKVEFRSHVGRRRPRPFRPCGARVRPGKPREEDGGQRCLHLPA